MTRIAIISAALLCQVACGGSDTEAMCKAVVNKEAQCDKHFDKKDTDKMVAVCVAFVDKDDDMKAEIKAEHECAKKDSCADFKACKNAARDKKRLEKLAKEEDLAKRADKCEMLSAKVLSDKAKKVCEPGMKHWEAEIKKAADTGAKLKVSLCFTAERLAKKFSDKRAAGVKALCAQVEAAHQVKQAVDKSAAEVKKAKPSLPFECSYGAKKLDKLPDSPWKTKMYKKLAKACYVDVGTAIAEKAKPSKYICDYNVSRVIKAAKKFKLLGSNPKLLAALQKHKKCSKQLAAAK